jgi:O-methyltransferase
MLMKAKAKEVVKTVLSHLGYELRRLLKRDDALLTLAPEIAREYARYVSPWPIFSPWASDGDFLRQYSKVRGLIAGSPERAYTLISLARYAKGVRGNFAEAGVFRGGSALLLAEVVKNTDKKFYLFDSFQGLPKADPTRDPQHFRGGDFSEGAETVKQRLSEFQPWMDFREGWIPETFDGLASERYAFAHVDVDLYQATLDCCRYFYPRLTPGGILLFDEYGFASTRGEKLAADEFFSDKPERPIPLITGQALVLKMPEPVDIPA